MPGTCFVRKDCSWSDPFPPHPPPEGIAPSFVRLLLRYIWVCQTSHLRTLLSYSLRIFSTGSVSINSESKVGSPGSRVKDFNTCAGSSTTQSQYKSRDNDLPCVAFRLFRHRRHPGLNSLSRLNTRPVSSPVNASHTALRLYTHDSGPMRFAKPSTYGTFIHYLLPVLTGAPRLAAPNRTSA